MRIKCPTCKNELEDVPADYAARPFCSMRCKLADLSNWMGGVYKIAGPLSDDELDGQQSLN